MKIWSVVILFFLVSGSFAQLLDDASFYYVESSDHVTINNQRGEISTSVDVYEKAKFLTSDMLFLSRKSIPYDKFRKIEDLNAYTLLDNGQKKQVKIYETKDELGGMIFYSDNKRKEFYFPNVKEGAEVVHSYKEVHSNEIPFSYIFQFASYFPTEKARLTLEFSNSVEVDFKLFNTEGINIDFAKKKGRKATTYTWEANDLTGVRIDNENDSDYESRIYYVPHIVIYLKSYTDEKGETVRVLDKVDDLYGWYYQLIQRIDEGDNEEVKKIADKLTAGMISEKEKARTIYQWVQSNISYVAFGDGFGGFVPRGAASVCDKKYGDCKDMSHLLYVMLNHVNVEAYHAWIGSRNKPYVYEENPTPYVDDHMITMAVVDGDSIFMDGTDSFVEFGYPSSFTQGKEALVGVDESEFFVKKVPVVASANNTIDVSTETYLDNGQVIAKEKRTLKGLEKTSFIFSYLKEKGNKTDEEFLNTEYKLGNNKTRYTDILFEGLDNASSELTLAFDSKMEDYYREIGNRIFFNMNFDRLLQEESIDIAEREYGKKFDNQFQINYQTKLKIPEGYSIKNLPERASFEHDDYGFDISYTSNDEFVTQTKSLYIDLIHLGKEDFPQWNDFIKSLVSEYKKNLVFVKN